jgi:hypothetical protein
LPKGLIFIFYFYTPYYELVEDILDDAYGDEDEDDPGYDEDDEYYDEDGDAAVYTRKYMNKLKNTVEILNRFKNLFYYLKFKIKFIKWFLRSQEKKIMSKNHPTKIVELLDNGIEIDELEKYL